MNDPITIRLYEEPGRNAAHHTGGYTPVHVTGWLYDAGDNIGLEDDYGGFLLGVIVRVDPAPHADADGAHYRVATVEPKD